MPLAAITIALTLLLQPATQPAGPADSADGRALAEKIVKSAGGDVWPKVNRLKFTFNVEDEGTIVASVKHDWDVRTGIDTVTIGDKTISTNVYENKTREGDELQAFKRWTNDAYWLLMPLKLLDGGIQYGPVMNTRDMPPSRGRFTISFAGVGLTPGDQYDLSVDLRENRVTHWVYKPDAEKSIGFTWENYQDFNGLVLSTEHKTDDGKRRIFFTDIEVQTDR